jgi:hypothetical protein
MNSKIKNFGYIFFSLAETDYTHFLGILLVVDATTMTEIGRAYVPISIPFGFHNRFFSKPDLGLPEGFSVNQFRPTVPTTQTTSPITATWTKITVASTVVPGKRDLMVLSKLFRNFGNYNASYFASYFAFNMATSFCFFRETMVATCSKHIYRIHIHDVNEKTHYQKTEYHRKNPLATSSTDSIPRTDYIKIPTNHTKNSFPKKFISARTIHEYNFTTTII